MGGKPPPCDGRKEAATVAVVASQVMKKMERQCY
jgi:hypothetical protein